MRRSWILGVVVAVALAACGGGGAIATDAGVSVGGANDAGFAACSEFQELTGTPVPAHISGQLAAADIESPPDCDVTDAPYGTESAGPDSVVLLTGLVPGEPYVVRVSSADDLLFYVATGCATPTGPSSAQCLLFEDATTSGDEVGAFTAPSPSVYVIVDYYASHAPPDGGSFTLDVYHQTCSASSECSAGLPVCANGACVECATSFDCASPAAAFCDPTQDRCVAAQDGCTADDANEPTDDGPAGATVLALDGSGHASHAAHVCSSPATESDFYAFDVADPGDTWDLSVAWPGPRDLALDVYAGSGAATGELYGMSYWQQPAHVRLTYLQPGRYYARVRELADSPNAAPLAYTLAAARTPGAPCAATADCAAEFANQLYRGRCAAGACVDIDGSGTIPAGGACDALADCAAGLACPSFYFTADADTRDVCAATCNGDHDCSPGFLCTTYLQQNFCVLPCADDLQCPTVPSEAPPSGGGPWTRLTCQPATGRCLP